LFIGDVKKTDIEGLRNEEKSMMGLSRINALLRKISYSKVPLVIAVGAASCSGTLL
jgi:hypothetical protein